MKLTIDIIREVIQEVLEEEDKEKQQPQQSPDTAIKLKIDIPDSPFEDEEDDEDESGLTKVDEALPAVAMGVARAAAGIGRVAGRAVSSAGKSVSKMGSKFKKGGGKSKNSLSDFGKDMGNELAYDSFYQDDDGEEIEEITENQLRMMVRDSIFKGLKKSKFINEAGSLGGPISFGSDIASNYIAPKRDTSGGMKTFHQKFSSPEARSIIDGQLKQMAGELRKVQNKVIKTWMQGAKSGAIDFFDIIRGLKTGDASRAYPYEVDFLVNVLTKDKIIDRFRSYFKGKKGKPRK